MRFLVMIEPVVTILSLWILINAIHAVATSKSDKIENRFWSLSNWIKKDLGLGNGKEETKEE